MKIRLVVLPPTDIRKRTAEWAKKISKIAPHHFVVDNKNLLPHITIFSMLLEEKQIPELEKKIKKIIKAFKTIKLELKKFESYEGVWLMWSVKPSLELSKLLKALYKQAVTIDHSAVKILKPYRPHITFTKFRSTGKVERALKEFSDMKRVFTVSRVAIAYDKDTQVPGIIKSFKLK